MPLQVLLLPSNFQTSLGLISEWLGLRLFKLITGTWLGVCFPQKLSFPISTDYSNYMEDQIRFDHKDVGDRFVFQFEHEADRNLILYGGPWFYRNTMVILTKYDGIGPVEVIPLRSIETWVAVKGLAPALRNKVVVSLVGSSMGCVIRFDQAALHRME